MNKLKDFLFESEEPLRRTRKNYRPRDQGAGDENHTNKWGYVLIAVFTCAALLIVWSSNQKNIEVPLDKSSLCPLEDLAGTTYILMDLSNPLSDEQRSDLQASIEKASENLKQHERLSISRMEPDQNNARVHLLDFCNPTYSEDIKDIAGRSINPKQDCPAIIAKTFKFHPRVGEVNRERIYKICANRAKLDKKIEDAVKTIPETNHEQPRSYIIDSIEDVMRDANSRSGDFPKRLVAFSDMLQNADWFSQYKKQHGEWTLDNINQRRKNAPQHMKTPPKNNFSEVLLCYQENADTDRILKRAEQKNSHRAMWKDYFAESNIFRTADPGGCSSKVIDMMQKDTGRILR